VLLPPSKLLLMSLQLLVFPTFFWHPAVAFMLRLESVLLPPPLLLLTSLRLLVFPTFSYRLAVAG
jgi:hypothetical protein